MQVADLFEFPLDTELKTFDWLSEFDVARFPTSSKQLARIENRVYEAWKTKPNETLALWWRYFPQKPESNDMVPDFIVRKQLQDKSCTL